jgi:hypothetical protein
MNKYIPDLNQEIKDFEENEESILASFGEVIMGFLVMESL